MTPRDSAGDTLFDCSQKGLAILVPGGIGQRKKAKSGPAEESIVFQFESVFIDAGMIFLDEAIRVSRRGARLGRLGWGTKWKWRGGPRELTIGGQILINCGTPFAPIAVFEIGADPRIMPEI